MRLVEFTTVDDKTIKVNPEHVATVQGRSQSTTEIALVSGRHIIVKDTPSFVAMELTWVES